MRISMRVLVAELCALTVACSGGGDPTEVHDNAWGGVTESDIRAALIEDNVEVMVPLRSFTEPTLSGRVQIELFDIAEGEPVSVGRTSLAFSQSVPSDWHRVVIRGAGTGLERVDTATLVVDWRVELSGGDLYGHRSLFDALGRLDVQLLGPTELPGAGASPLRVIVRDPHTDSVVSGADVTAELVEAGEDDVEILHALFTGRTDGRGELLEQIALPAEVSGGTVRVTVTHDGVQIWTNHRVSRRADNQVYLSADKTIYKPGQEIALRLLAVEGPERLPFANQDVVFEAQDGEGNKVFKRRTQTDTFGVASTTVPTDTRVNEGLWTFSAEVATKATRIQIPVERYNLPKMQVTVTVDRPYALPGETVRGQVSALYLFGEPVTNGSVTVNAQAPYVGSLPALAGTTNDHGQYDFELLVPEWDSSRHGQMGGRLEISALIRDTADQEERGASSVVLASAPLVIGLVSDTGGLIRGERNALYVTVADPLGRPLLADLNVSGVGIEESLSTNASGIAELGIVPGLEDSLDLNITATDGADRIHERSFALSTRDDAPLRIRSDKAVYRAGDVATVTVAGSSNPERIYLDIYRGAEGVESLAVDATRGSTEIPITITEAMRGLLVVDVLALTAEGAIRASKPLLVDPENQLDIELSSDRESYRPGDNASVQLTVHDSEGRPQITSVGLTVVNEASFALGGEPTTSIRQLSGIDSRVLPPSMNVLGRGPGDLLSIGDVSEQDRLARVLFTQAGEVATPSFAYNTEAEELPRVISSLERKLSYDGAAFIESLNQRALRGVVTPDNIGRLLRGTSLADPFGQPYDLDAEEDEYGRLMMRIVSQGPDERRGTDDDIRAQVSLETLFWYSRGGRDRGASDPIGAVPGVADDDALNAEFGAARADDGDADGASGGSHGTSVRSDFRETVYTHPTLITDASGHASVSFPLAHSITTWRVSADGSTRSGHMGNARHEFRTFQSFFVDFTMPTDMTVGDTLELPAVIYNYLDETRTVQVSVDEADWFELETAATQRITLMPSEVRAVKFRVNITRAGEHTFTVRGSADGISDAIARQVSVAPDGYPEDETVSGSLEGGRVHAVYLPTDTVEGGAFLELAVTPGFAAEVAQGVESLMKEPNGCFEQTTSSAWPNTLVANYLEETGQMTPELRERTLGLVTRGYQRLLTFESPTGGYNWWGDNDPGNRILSAIMLWHLKDLEALIEPDENVRDRTLAWLLGQQNADGSWEAGDSLHAGNEVLGTSKARATAFIAWGLAHTGWADAAVGRAAAWLGGHLPPETDLYANALAANALALADPTGATTDTLLNRLDGMKVSLDEGAMLWPTETPSWTGAAGDAASIETTGLVAYAFMNANRYPDDSAGAMRFITSNKDAVGTWYNTQATMNALRALSAAAGARDSSAIGTLTVWVNGAVAEVITLSEDTSDLYRSFDLSDHLLTGDNRVELDMLGTGEVSYRLTRQAYRPNLPASQGPLGLSVTYDTTGTTVGAPVRATLVATNSDVNTRNQVMVRLGRAPGFVPRQEDLDALVNTGRVSRYEVRANDVTFYLMNMGAGESRELSLRLTPSLAVEAMAPESSIYAYYEPDLRQSVAAQPFTVAAP